MSFRSLTRFNYRVWAAGALVSNVGTWMQRTAQDWLVLTQLTHHNATAVGIVMALQFGPQVLLLPWTGFAADHFDRRKLLFATQAAMGALALGLGILTVTGLVQLWHVYVFAFLFGCVTAFDAPVRQTFVADLVGRSRSVERGRAEFHLVQRGADDRPCRRRCRYRCDGLGVGLSDQRRLVCRRALLADLASRRRASFERKGSPRQRKLRRRASAMSGTGRISRRSCVMLFLIGTFGLNFPIFISTMAVSVFHTGAGQYGLLSSIMAVGSVTGALLAAGRDKPRFAAAHRRRRFRGRLLAGRDHAELRALWPGPCRHRRLRPTFTTTINSLVQLSTEPAMRGRVMAILLAIALGGTPIGAPIVGWVADHFGPRWALGVGAAGGFAAAIVGIYYLAKHAT